MHPVAVTAEIAQAGLCKAEIDDRLNTESLVDMCGIGPELDRITHADDALRIKDPVSRIVFDPTERVAAQVQLGKVLRHNDDFGDQLAVVGSNAFSTQVFCRDRGDGYRHDARTQRTRGCGSEQDKGPLPVFVVTMQQHAAQRNKACLSTPCEKKKGLSVCLSVCLSVSIHLTETCPTHRNMI